VQSPPVSSRHRSEYRRSTAARLF